MVKCAPLYYFNTSENWSGKYDMSFNGNIYVSEYDLIKYSLSWILELKKSRGWRNRRELE